MDTSGLEAESGYKIFMFHTAITELKPKELERMDSAPVSLLPKGFDYYAGGHVHIVSDISLDGYKRIVYPGPTFPNSFSELEKLGGGSLYIVEGSGARKVDIVSRPVKSIVLDCKGRHAEDISAELMSAIGDLEPDKAVVLIRLGGALASGKTSDIDFRGAFKALYDRGAYFVMKSTSGLHATALEQIKVKPGSAEEIEDELIREHAGQIRSGMADEIEATKMLLKVLDTGRKDGEKVHDFEDRVRSEMDRCFQSLGK
jgi:hypothetical protein